MLTKFVGFTALLLMLTGCTARTQQPPILAGPPPTVMPLLSANNVLPLTPEPVTEVLLHAVAAEATLVAPEIVDSPTAVVEGGSTSTDAGDSNLREVYLFEDTLDPNWELVHTDGMAYDLANTSRWFEPMDAKRNLDSGAQSIAVKPEHDSAKLYFTLRADATQSYPRDQVVGITFWLNGGDNFLDAEALAITVVGSNTAPIWSEADNPIQADGEGLYSETRLYFLDINRSIPPNTWVQVVVIFKNLLFDPEFDYLTGFYFKNDVGYRDTFYIDNIATLWQSEAAQ